MKVFLSQSSRVSLLGILSTSLVLCGSWGAEAAGTWVTGGCELLSVGSGRQALMFTMLSCLLHPSEGAALREMTERDVPVRLPLQLLD